MTNCESQRRQPVGERLVAGKQGLDPGGGGLEVAVVPPRRFEGEAARDVVQVWQLVTGEGPGLRLERDELDVQPVAPVRFRTRPPLGARAGR